MSTARITTSFEIAPDEPTPAQIDPTELRILQHHPRAQTSPWIDRRAAERAAHDPPVSTNCSASRAENDGGPGGARTEVHAPTGADRRDNHPPVVEVRALACARPTHRPLTPRGWRAMPRFGPVPVARSVPVPAFRVSSGEPGSNLGTIGKWPFLRGTSWGGAPGDFGLPSPLLPGKPVCCVENDESLSRVPDPLRRGVRSPVRGIPSRRRITPGQGVFLNSQGSPQNFLVTPRKPFVVHRSCTGFRTGCRLFTARSVRPSHHRGLTITAPHRVQWRS